MANAGHPMLDSKRKKQFVCKVQGTQLNPFAEKCFFRLVFRCRTKSNFIRHIVFVLMFSFGETLMRTSHPMYRRSSCLFWPRPTQKANEISRTFVVESRKARTKEQERERLEKGPTRDRQGAKSRIGRKVHSDWVQ